MKLLVLGAESQLGTALTRVLQGQGVDHAVLATDELDLLKQMDLLKKVTRAGCTQVINVTSSVNLVQAQNDPDAASKLDITNTRGMSALAEVCKHLDLPLLHHSSSYVFDGQKVHPYAEADETNPICRYGQSKWYGERAIREALPSHVILRTDWMFSKERNKYFRDHIEDCKQSQGKIAVMSNRLSPTPANDVARVLLAIARQVDCAADVWGTYHYCALQPMSHDHFVENFLQEAARYDPALAEVINKLQITKIPVHLPYIPNSALNCQRIFETFGIKQRSRAGELSLLLQDIYGIQPVEPEVLTQEVEPEFGRLANTKQVRKQLRDQSRDQNKDGQAAASNSVKKNKSKAQAKNQLRKTKDSNPPAQTDATRKGSQQP
ncbi:MAG: sugar nucleotide-binding protein [Pseudomonadota bacterium]